MTSTTPNAEAEQFLREVLRELLDGEQRLVVALRKGQHVSQLLGWEPARTWFQQELAGFARSSGLPPHRVLPCELHWRLRGSPVDIYLDVLNQVMEGRDSTWDRAGVYEGVEALEKVGE